VTSGTRAPLRRGARGNVILRVLVFGSVLFGPALCLAQVDSALPDAPVAAPGSAASRGAPQSDLTAADAPDPAPLSVSVDEGRAQAADVADSQRLVADIDLPPTGFDAAPTGARIDLDALFARMDRPSAAIALASIGDPSSASTERFHWKGVLWESFAFFGVENTQRLLADPYFRHVTADKPFWHDYIASVEQWDWHRWSDGDDFLVAYIAHPMQGSVTEFIWKQNSPRDRALRINDGPAYWHALFMSSLWATAYSFDQKLGPLGETALGSEGGYTYVVNCPYFCHYVPGDKVTNNTGWVKLVSTPVIGSVWTLMEDFLDHFVSDRVQGDDYTRIFPKILRGSLNPARTMANAMRWRKPWYRDYQHDAADVHITRRPTLLPGDDDVILESPTYDFFPHYVGFSLPVNTASCSHCRQVISGFGFGFARRIATYADLDSDVSYLPNASPLPSDRAGGDIVTGTFGLRSGYTNQDFSIKAFLRPGFLSYDRAYLTSPSTADPVPALGRITHFTTALGVDADLVIRRHLALRAVFANQPVRYREPYLDPPGLGTFPYYDWLSKKYFLTNANWTWQGGPVLRF
jgi:hypothetical protein